MATNGIWTTMTISRLVLLCFGVSVLPGCITFTNYAIPGDRLPVFLRAPEKGRRVPLNFALLGQRQPRNYTISSGDLLSIYIKGLLPAETNSTPPSIPGQSNFTNIYYPPTGQNSTPSLGLPIEVSAAGSINLPLLGLIPIHGLTVEQASAKIAEVCVEKKVAQATREFVYLSLIRSRVYRVLVIRDEAPSDFPQFVRKDAPLLTKRGHAQVVDLPVFENDVLHALTISGGLPAFDAYNEVWILRRDNVSGLVRQQFQESVGSSQPVPTGGFDNECIATARRIPMWVPPCESPTFSQEDVLLNDGDIVYIRAREEEFFYTGGLLAGGVVPMPRDRDIDILDAISLANGSVGGAGGASGVQVIPARGPGNVIPPSRATIVRKLPNKQQVTIRVDLTKALRDPKHRVMIQPQDLISLHYKPGELTANSALNLVNLNFIAPN